MSTNNLNEDSHLNGRTFPLIATPDFKRTPARLSQSHKIGEIACHRCEIQIAFPVMRRIYTRRHELRSYLSHNSSVI